MANEYQFHVLVVDDSGVDRKHTERLFQMSSCEVTAVVSGAKALEVLGLLEDDQAKKNPPPISSTDKQVKEVNLVITDFFMPGMTGYDLLKKIKGSSSFQDIPVVIMSSENDHLRIKRCLEEGAMEFLLKPLKGADMDKLKLHLLKGTMSDNPQQAQLQQKHMHHQLNMKRKFMEETLLAEKI